jgi:hypothetical protein
MLQQAIHIASDSRLFNCLSASAQDVVCQLIRLAAMRGDTKALQFIALANFDHSNMTVQ